MSIDWMPEHERVLLGLLVYRVFGRVESALWGLPDNHLPLRLRLLDFLLLNLHDIRLRNLVDQALLVLLAISHECSFQAFVIRVKQRHLDQWSVNLVPTRDEVWTVRGTVGPHHVCHPPLLILNPLSLRVWVRFWDIFERLKGVQPFSLA